MRDIKFRAWDKKLKKMINVYVISTQTESGKYVKECRGWWGENNQVLFAFGDVVWMQYTGLKDKNGKEIYEGDVVRWTDMLNNETEVFVVTSLQEFFETKGYREGEFGEHWDKELEVIGNVYENPELLKEEK